MTEFLKQTLVRGLIALLPVVIALYVLVQLIVGVRGLAKQVIGVLAGVPEDSVPYPTIIALLILLVVSFLLGLLASKITLSQRVGPWIGRVLLEKIPGYHVIRSIVHGFSGAGVDSGIKPALVMRADGSQVIAYLVEDHGNGLFTLFLPSSPSAATGTVAVYPEASVVILKSGLGDAVTALNQWGVGTQALLAKGLPSA